MTCTREQLVVGGEFVDDDGDIFTILMIGNSSVFWRDNDGYEGAYGVEFACRHWTPHDPRPDWRLDDLLVVNISGDEELRRFAGVDGSNVTCVFADGTDSLTQQTIYCDSSRTARLATPEDIERLSPKPESWWAKKR